MYRLVYISYTLMVASAGVTFIFLEDIETNYGIPSWGIGLISALSFGTAVIASVFIAPYGDRGHLKELGGLAFVAAIAGNIWIGFATELWSISVSRGLAGIGAGLFSVVGRKALVGDSIEDSGEKIGGFISAAVLGFIAGPALGAQLSEWGGIETPYLVIAIVLAVLAIPTMTWLSTAHISISHDVDAWAMLPLLKEPGVRAAVAAQVAVFINIGVFDATVDKYLTDLGVTNAQLGLLLLIIASPLLIVPRIAGRFVDRAARPANIMLLALIVFVPIVLTIGLWTGVAVFVTLAFFQTLMESTIFPASTRVVLNETGAEKSAIGTGLLAASGSTAAAISAFISPITYDAAGGPIGSFGISGSVAALLLVFAWWNIRQRDTSKVVVFSPT
jgi:MFS family permease